MRQLNRLVMGNKRRYFFIGAAIFWLVTMLCTTRINAPVAESPPSAATPVNASLLQMVPFIVFGIIAIVGMFVLRRWQRGGMHLSLNPRLAEPKEMTFDEHGWTFSDRLASTRVLWPALVRYEEDDQYIFLFTAKRLAHFIPKRVFASREQIEQLRMWAGALVHTNEMKDKGIQIQSRIIP